MGCTPTQELILEVLAARHRLGEHLWTFDSRTRAAAEVLAKAGLIRVLDGSVEHTYRARLTEAGRAQQLIDDYESPPTRKVRELEAEREVLWQRVAELQLRVAS
jgi:hypothetical protein